MGGGGENLILADMGLFLICPLPTINDFFTPKKKKGAQKNKNPPRFKN